MKFRYLKIDLESKTTYNCHAASSHPVDFNWLSNNRGELFNSDINVQERKMMLLNQRNSSCEQNCWYAEDHNAISPRIITKGEIKTHTEIITSPEIIELTIGADCNLTCTYCSKEYSSAWRRDIVNSGKYAIDDSDRYTPTNKDRVLLKISQPTLKNTEHYKLLLNEIKLASSGLKKLIITGGEPFLDNSLISTIKSLQLSQDVEIEIYSGLGVSTQRLTNIFNEIKTFKNLKIIVSAECTGELFEFNRYGNTWATFLDKINLIKQFDIKFNFLATLSNLTILGFLNFYKEFKNEKILLSFVYQPRMMSPFILDETSKDYIKSNLTILPEHMQSRLLQSISATPTFQEQQNIRDFLLEFSKRRNLSLDVFPYSMLQWLKIKD